MLKFLEWVFDMDTPPWVMILVIFVGAVLTICAAVVTIRLLVTGYWLPPLLFWVVVPSYAVYREYIKSGKPK